MYSRNVTSLLSISRCGGPHLFNVPVLSPLPINLFLSMLGCLVCPSV